MGARRSEAQWGEGRNGTAPRGVRFEPVRAWNLTIREEVRGGARFGRRRCQNDHF